MKKVVLIKPEYDDLWFRQKVMSDSESMAYNAGYDVSYSGYHYETGCIDFPKSEWMGFCEKLKNENFFYAYIKDCDSGEFVGYLNFKKDEEGVASMGIVIYSLFRGMGYMRPAMQELIKKARELGVIKLTDSVPLSREGALKVFYDMGFVCKEVVDGIKFGKVDKVAMIELCL